MDKGMLLLLKDIQDKLVDLGIQRHITCSRQHTCLVILVNLLSKTRNCFQFLITEYNLEQAKDRSKSCSGTG